MSIINHTITPAKKKSLIHLNNNDDPMQLSTPPSINNNKKGILSISIYIYIYIYVICIFFLPFPSFVSFYRYS
jgi:hypothetical protein